MAEIDVSLDEIIRRKKRNNTNSSSSSSRFKTSVVRPFRNANYDAKRKFSDRLQGDARMKIISKQRSQMQDARDRLNVIAKKTDARQRLLKLKATRMGQQRSKAMLPMLRKVATSATQRNFNLTRTIRPEQHHESEMELEDSNRMFSSTGKIIVLADQRNKAPTQAYYRTGMFPPVEKLVSKTFKSSLPYGGSPASVPSVKSRLSSENTSSAQGYRVVISNLHNDVSHDDIIELFGEIGPLRHASLIRPGIAEVFFTEWSHALKACETYDNRQLDGKPMSVKLVSATTIPTGNSGFAASRVENAKPRRKVSPNIDIVRHALFYKGGPNAVSSHQPMFSVTMNKK